jgi:hypothetical protein
MTENHFTQTTGGPWKVFWQGVNATAAAAWCLTSSAGVVLSIRGEIAQGATFATVCLLLGLGWLLAAVRSLRESGEPFVGSLFWFAASATLATAVSLASAVLLDITQKSEAIDPGARSALGLAIACGVIWFAISIGGAANAVARVKRERY